MSKKRLKREVEREGRIANQIIVDCYNEREAWTGWYCYLEEKLAFPFKAECIKERKMSPLKPSERVTVVGMLDDEADDLGEMMVEVEWHDRTMGLPLAQIKGLDVEEETAEQSRTGTIGWRKDDSFRKRTIALNSREPPPSDQPMIERGLTLLGDLASDGPL